MEQAELNTKHRVLIIDDEHVTALTLARIFCSRGYDARPAGSAEEGLRLIQRWPPHLAVVDVRLPGMNGIEFAILVSSSCADCKLLLFSGQPESGELLDEARRNGHKLEMLAKPVHPDSLLERARQLLQPAA